MKLNLRRTIRYYYLRFIRLRGSPHSLALGAAVGAAIAVTPTLPLHTVTIIPITLLLRVSTIAALIAGTVVSNPLTFAAQYYLSWKIGDMILPNRLTWERLQQVLAMVKEADFMEGVKILSHLSVDALLVMLTGGIILAVPLGIATYFLSYRFFDHLQEKRRQKHLLN
ncbi:MAG: DUF2062 domain-containing protein [Thermodesulfobacteriota bacterium]|nr:DUF2062 domain-containing protein [Thermodesulfobacteriota bacterium]